MYRNYVALPRAQAFRIEYWKLEEAKLRRRPPEQEFSRKVMVVIGGGSGIGREVGLRGASRGAHVVVGDLLDAGGNIVHNFYTTVNNVAGWVQKTYNVSAYAGGTYYLYFGVHGDGGAAITAHHDGIFPVDLCAGNDLAQGNHSSRGRAPYLHASNRGDVAALGQRRPGNNRKQP